MTTPLVFTHGAAGTAFYAASAAWFLFEGVMGLLQRWRAAALAGRPPLAEERQLTQALGADYERFAAGRKRLIPGVW